jgi:hypothetical protein
MHYVLDPFKSTAHYLQYNCHQPQLTSGKAVADIRPVQHVPADLSVLPANITPFKLVSDFLRCLYNDVMLPTLTDNYGNR